MTSKDVPAEVRYARGTEGQAPSEGIARDLSELARDMRADQSSESMLRRISAAAVVEVDGAVHAGISEIDGKQIRTVAATDSLVEEIDEIQHRLGQGPCLTSLREQITVRTDDLEREERWPDFAHAAFAAGVRSMLSVQLFVHDDNLGALNLFALEPNSFDQVDESNAMLVAAHAAVAMRGAKLESNLRTALASRDVIGQAKGILMERFKISPTEAFDLLVMSSQNSHRKLRDVADELSATGELRVTKGRSE